MEKNIKRKKIVKKKGIKNYKTFFTNIFFLAIVGMAVFLMVFYQPTHAATTTPPQSFTGEHTTGNDFFGGKAAYQTIAGTDQIVYCYDHLKNMIQGEMVLSHAIQDAGLTYIIEHGYPNNPDVSPGTEMDKYMVTQYAIWIYKDRHLINNGAGVADNEDGDLAAGGTNGKIDLLNNHGEYSQAIKDLLAGAEAAAAAPAPNYDLQFTTSSLTFAESDTSFTSSMIGINQNSAYDSYSVTITAPSGYYLKTNTGKTIRESEVANTNFAKTETFQIIIPANGISDSSDLNVSVKASATATSNTVYMYAPADGSDTVQNGIPTVLYPTETTDTATLSQTLPNAQLSVLKVDASTKEPIAGATLRLLNEDGEAIDEWVTTTEARIFQDLIPGATYTVEEVSAATGYVANGQKQSVTLSATNTGTPASIVMENQATRIQVAKIDLGTGKYIAGAVLKITNQDTGQVYTDSLVTTDQPVIINRLPVGNYLLEEVSAPAGYVTSKTPIRFTVSNTGTVQEVFIKNDYTYVSIADQKISINLDIEGFKIQIKDSNGQVVDSYTSNGKVHTTQELSVGKYTIEEIEAPAGYVCYPSPIEVYVPEKGTVGANEVYIPNDYTKVQISKVDITTGEELPGAEIEIHDDNGKVVEKWTSTDTPHEIDRLPVGKYELVETIAPEGYILQENTVSFEVAETGEVQTTFMQNQPKIEVPNTADNANIVTYLCGIVIVLCGIGLILYNVQEHKKKKRK